MWKFICNSETERECLVRNLFGNHKMVDHIHEEDTLFLHNRETDELLGPFEAATDGTMNIVEHAWDGRFGYQVYVMWNDPVYRLPLNDVSDPEKTENPLWLSISYKFQALPESHTKKLLDALQNHELSKKVITKR